MDSEEKALIIIGTLILLAIMCISGCTMYTTKCRMDALKSGATGVDIKIADGGVGDSITTSAIMAKKNCEKAVPDESSTEVVEPVK